MRVHISVSDPSSNCATPFQQELVETICCSVLRINKRLVFIIVPLSKIQPIIHRMGRTFTSLNIRYGEHQKDHETEKEHHNCVLVLLGFTKILKKNLRNRRL